MPASKKALCEIKVSIFHIIVIVGIFFYFVIFLVKSFFFFNCQKWAPINLCVITQRKEKKRRKRDSPQNNTRLLKFALSCVFDPVYFTAAGCVSSSLVVGDSCLVICNGWSRSGTIAATVLVPYDGMFSLLWPVSHELSQMFYQCCSSTWCPSTAAILSSSGRWREDWTGPSPQLLGRATGWM